MAENSTIIELTDVRRVYNGSDRVTAVDGISLSVGRGARLAIMGPSGSGKSTLLNLICGLDVPTAGSIVFEGRDLAAMNDDERTKLRREKIGMVFQTFNLLPTLSALENVALPLRLNGTGPSAAETQAAEILKRVGLEKRLDHRPDELSGGERQRVAIARALVFGPPVLLADEPTGNLDSHNGDEILDLLCRLHDDLGTTIILVTHSDHAAAICDRHIKLLDGRVVADEHRNGGNGVT